MYYKTKNNNFVLLEFMEQILWTSAPAAAASADKDEPGASSQDRTDGGPGQDPDSAEGWAGSCSPGTTPGSGGSAAGGHQAEKGAAGAGARDRSCSDRRVASVKFWDFFTCIPTDDCKKKYLIFSRCLNYLWVGFLFCFLPKWLLCVTNLVCSSSSSPF